MIGIGNGPRGRDGGRHQVAETLDAAKAIVVELQELGDQRCLLLVRAVCIRIRGIAGDAACAVAAARSQDARDRAASQVSACARALLHVLRLHLVLHLIHLLDFLLELCRLHAATD